MTIVNAAETRTDSALCNPTAQKMVRSFMTVLQDVLQSVRLIEAGSLFLCMHVCIYLYATCIRQSVSRCGQSALLLSSAAKIQLIHLNQSNNRLRFRHLPDWWISHLVPTSQQPDKKACAFVFARLNLKIIR